MVRLRLFFCTIKLWLWKTVLLGFCRPFLSRVIQWLIVLTTCKVVRLIGISETDSSPRWLSVRASSSKRVAIDSKSWDSSWRCLLRLPRALDTSCPSRTSIHWNFCKLSANHEYAARGSILFRLRCRLVPLEQSYCKASQHQSSDWLHHV